MQFGFRIPIRGPLANRADIAAVARAGDRLGYKLVTVSDHIVVPQSIASTYPYSETGEWPGSTFDESIEQLTLLAFLAGVTETVRLVPAVMVVPHRSPLHCAKALTTIDLLSKGRLTVGCGAGWMREEFEVLGVPTYDDRGTLVDEYLNAFKKVWTEDTPTVEGKYVRFSGVSVLPHPVQKPHPPLWIGGESGPALRRAARLGDGWFPIGNNPKFRLETPDLYRARRDTLFGLLEQAGRDPKDFTLAMSAQWSTYGKEQKGPTGGRRIFTGNADDFLEDTATFGDLGITSVVINFQYPTRSETLERMQAFAEEVMAKLPG
ncbi:MAG: LLM class F420-dependent oxidoreductase [Alphaproteobacteria bacterium]